MKVADIPTDTFNRIVKELRADCMTDDDMIRLFGQVFHGAGETLWIRDGRVVAELSAFQPGSESLIVSQTRQLL